MITSDDPHEGRDRSARWMIALSGSLIAIGGILLGLQIDRNGAWSGTGLNALAIGALISLVWLFTRIGTDGQFPRNVLSAFAALAGFLGLAFVASGVLAPGGPWMFFELLVLVVFIAQRRSRNREGLDRASVVLLASMLMFRLWISYQGSENRWQFLSVDIPILSSIPFAWLEPIKSVSLGSFTPAELGFPLAGLDFPPSLALWTAGFSLCALGLILLQNAAREHENDRIHAVIGTLPTAMSVLVERLLPEEEWRELGLHGLSERRMCKRIERLVATRIAHQREIQRAFEASALLELARTEGFSGNIHRALLREASIETRGANDARSGEQPR